MHCDWVTCFVFKCLKYPWLKSFHRREPRDQHNMKNSAFKFLILTGLCKMALCFFGYNIYIPIKKTWPEARQYCREKYTDLASIHNQEEDKWLFTIAENQGLLNAWIGLYKDGNTWKWSGGKNASFLNWSPLHTENTNKDDNCVVYSERGWKGRKCEMNKYFFYCFQSSMVLVKEKKTWEEAMEQCRHQNSNLVSLPSESTLVRTLQTSMEAQTDHVWTGLRYLAGSWLWIDGDDIEYQDWSQEEMPECPATNRQCGVLSLEGKHWNSWDCVDKLNFVCY